jgi:hypothetical protein
MANEAVNRPLGGIIGELAKFGIDVTPNYAQPASGVVDLTSVTKIDGTTLTASAAELNLLKYADKMTKVVKVALAALDTGGGVFAWQNSEEGASIIITRIILDVTTVATAACTLDIGTTATSAATVSDNLIDGLDVNAATGVFDNLGNAGTNGKTRQKLASGKWVTGRMKTGAAAGLVGSAYIEYLVA